MTGGVCWLKCDSWCMRSSWHYQWCLLQPYSVLSWDHQRVTFLLLVPVPSSQGSHKSRWTSQDSGPLCVFRNLASLSGLPGVKSDLVVWTCFKKMLPGHGRNEVAPLCIVFSNETQNWRVPLHGVSRETLHFKLLPGCSGFKSFVSHHSGETLAVT